MLLLQVVMYNAAGTRTQSILSYPEAKREAKIAQQRKAGYHPMTTWLRKGVVPTLPFETTPLAAIADENTPVRHRLPFAMC